MPLDDGSKRTVAGPPLSFGSTTTQTRVLVQRERRHRRGVAEAEVARLPPLGNLPWLERTTRRRRGRRDVLHPGAGDEALASISTRCIRIAAEEPIGEAGIAVAAR